MASESFNSFNPFCLRSSCLNEVAGYIEHNPVDQYSSCVSLFGTPVVTTITPTNVVISTETTTVSYVDIVVSLRTEVSTVDQTVTVPTEVTETDTAYWTTFVDTETVTVAAPSTTRGSPGGRARKGRRRRGRCARPPTTSAALPTTSAPPPIPPNCASQADYFSACSCIYAASDAILTVTADASTSVSTVLKTVSRVVPSTLESVVVSLETSTVPVTSTATETTVTVTTAESSTTTVVIETQVAQLVVASAGDYAGQLAVGVDDETGRGIYNVLVENTAAGSNIDFVTTGGQPWLDGEPGLLLYADQGWGNYGTLVFMNATEGAKFGQPLICGANDDSSISCTTTSGYSYLMVCPNGPNNWVYVWEDPTQAYSTCSAVTLSLVAD